jgi:hypothetical protein
MTDSRVATPADAAPQLPVAPSAADSYRELFEDALLGAHVAREDEDGVRAVVDTVLNRQGYRVLDASGRKAAVDSFDSRPADVDLLVTDAVMPR